MTDAVTEAIRLTEILKVSGPFLSSETTAALTNRLNELVLELVKPAQPKKTTKEGSK